MKHDPKGSRAKLKSDQFQARTRVEFDAKSVVENAIQSFELEYQLNPQMAPHVVPDIDFAHYSAAQKRKIAAEINRARQVRKITINPHLGIFLGALMAVLGLPIVDAQIDDPLATFSPTGFPTPLPTSVPALPPTPSPVMAPTLNPSISTTQSLPSFSPSDFPTSATQIATPTDFPSNAPTFDITPTEGGTVITPISPTGVPSPISQFVPTPSPTGAPSLPTPFPTSALSSLPTMRASIAPTQNGNTVVNFAPTGSPINSPSLSFVTGSPTAQVDSLIDQGNYPTIDDNRWKIGVGVASGVVICAIAFCCHRFRKQIFPSFYLNQVVPQPEAVVVDLEVQEGPQDIELATQILKNYNIYSMQGDFASVERNDAAAARARSQQVSAASVPVADESSRYLTRVKKGLITIVGGFIDNRAIQDPIKDSLETFLTGVRDNYSLTLPQMMRSINDFMGHEANQSAFKKYITQARDACYFYTVKNGVISENGELMLTMSSFLGSILNPQRQVQRQESSLASPYGAAASPRGVNIEMGAQTPRVQANNQVMGNFTRLPSRPLGQLNIVNEDESFAPEHLVINVNESPIFGSSVAPRAQSSLRQRSPNLHATRDLEHKYSSSDDENEVSAPAISARASVIAPLQPLHIQKPQERLPNEGTLSLETFVSALKPFLEQERQRSVLVNQYTHSPDANAAAQEAAGHRFIFSQAFNLPETIALQMNQDWDSIRGREGWDFIICKNIIVGIVSGVNGDNVINSKSLAESKDFATLVGRFCDGNQGANQADVRAVQDKVLSVIGEVMQDEELYFSQDRSRDVNHFLGRTYNSLSELLTLKRERNISLSDVINKSPLHSPIPVVFSEMSSLAVDSPASPFSDSPISLPDNSSQTPRPLASSRGASPLASGRGARNLGD